MEPVNIPSYIDDPPHFLLWSADEMAPILLGLVIGIFTGNALVLCLLGLVTTKLYRRFRDGRPDGFILHAIYQHLERFRLCYVHFRLRAIQPQRELMVSAIT